MQLPKFLKLKKSNKRIISIDFGASFIKMVYLEARGARFILLAYALNKINSIEKTSEELSLALREMLKANSITSKEVYLSISDPEQIFIKKLSLPVMPKNDLLNAVKWKLKDEFTLGSDESVSDLQIIREYTDNEDAKKIELSCIFAKKEVINKYLSAVAACGLMPLRISNSIFDYCSILNSLSVKPQISAILDIGQSRSNITIYQNNKLCFVRNLNLSVARFSASLVGALETDKGKIEISPDEAHQLIQQYGIILDESVKLQGAVSASQLTPLMRPLLEILAKELTRSFDFFKSESALGAPEILYITGGGANLKNLDIYLTEQLKFKVEKLPLPDSLDIENVDKEKFSSDANLLSSAIGLGVSTFGINLLPSEIKSQKVELIQKSTLRITAIAISAIFIFSWFVVSFQVRDYKKRLKIAKLHLQSVEEVKKLKQMVDARENYIDKIHIGKVPSGGLLKLIGAVIPANIILDEFDFNQTSHSMHLKGVITASQDSVEKVLTDFMNALEVSNFITEANLIHSMDNQGIHNFEIECQLTK